MKILAINGGDPIVKNHLDLIQKWPKIKSKDMIDVLNLFENGKVSGRNSDIIELFENKIKRYIGSKYASAFNSGTSGLHSALKALNLLPGDEVIVPSLTFSASALSVIHNLCIPIFVDVEIDTFNIDPNDLKNKINKKTKAIMVVHFQGLPANMKKINKIAKDYGLKIIEDCAQSFGASINNKMCGTLGDIGVFSMNPAKQLPSCGELGCIVSNDLLLINDANLTKMYGQCIINNERVYNSVTLGYNYLPNTIQAIFASNKLDEFDLTINQIISNAEILSSCIDTIPFLKKPYIPKGYKHVYHMYRVFVDGSSLGLKNNILRKAIMDIMEKEGLKMRLYQNSPVSGQKIFKDLIGFGNGYPWIINKDRYNDYKKSYDINNFPNTLKIISESFVVGGIGSGPLYFQNRDVILKYIEGFNKINKNLNELVEYYKQIEKDYKEPWQDEIAKVSDTNGKFI